MGWWGYVQRRLAKPGPLEVAQASIAAINRREWDTLVGLLADDFYFQDGHHHRVDGKEKYLAAIRRMVAEVPDYELRVDSYEVVEDVVIMRGSSYAAVHSFRTAAIWKVRVVKGGIVYLHSFRANSNLRLYGYAGGRD